jgi:hypothetical protein
MVYDSETKNATPKQTEYMEIRRLFFGGTTRQPEIFSRALCVSWLISNCLKFKTKMFAGKNVLNSSWMLAKTMSSKRVTTPGLLSPQ